MDTPSFDKNVHAEDARPAGAPDQCFYCKAPIGQEHVDGCVILDMRRLASFPVFVPQPIETYRDGDFVLFWFPHGEKGIGGWETAMSWREGGKLLVGWTHGGPNSGSDFDFVEEPTMWCRLPDGPGQGG